MRHPDASKKSPNYAPQKMLNRLDPFLHTFGTEQDTKEEKRFKYEDKLKSSNS